MLIATSPSDAGPLFTTSIRMATGFTANTGDCPVRGGIINIGAAPVLNIQGTSLSGNSSRPVQFARYEIVADAAGIPSLWRSPRGGLSAAGAYVAAPGAGAGWQLVATGIEDLQVEYRNGAGLPAPP